MFLNCTAHSSASVDSQSESFTASALLEMLKLFAVASVNENVEPIERSWPDPVIYSELAVGISYCTV